jgi:uncharacterized repeat protein (TIGR03806 family)
MTSCSATRFAALLGLTLALAACGGGSAPEVTGDGGDTTAADPTTATPEDPTTPDPVTPDPETPPPPPDVHVFSAATAPQKLSAWGVLPSDGQTLALPAGALPYALNTPLFSDYAHKFRAVWLPPGTQMDYTASGPLQFPVGAIVTKTFFYPKAEAAAAGAIGARQELQVEGGETIDLAEHRLIETRLMVREADGRWGAVTYVWDADQRDATLDRDGRTMAIELVDAQGTRTPFTYAVPTDTQCVQCHATDTTTMAFQPIGPKAANMNRSYAYAGGTVNQLDKLAALQMLAGYAGSAPALPVWNDPAVSLEARARAYLDVNCSSCHNPTGRSGTGLWLGFDVAAPLSLGVCKTPEGGQQHRRFTYDITPGNPGDSFLYYRITNYRSNSDPQSVAMPELGRHVFDAEGNALIRDWIASIASCAN